MKGLLIVDHGSRREAANNMIFCVRERVQAQCSDILVAAAHMELADPDIATGIRYLIESGVTDITVHPFMLSPGRHSTEDIPNLVREALQDYPHITFQITPHLGLHDGVISAIVDRAKRD